jgi:hypothetical protein
VQVARTRVRSELYTLISNYRAGPSVVLVVKSDRTKVK